MSSLSQFVGGSLPPKAIVNAFSTTGVAISAQTRIDLAHQAVGAKSVLSGALSAGVLTTIVSVTGGGVLNFAGAWTVDTTSRTLRLQIVIDGVTAFDSTSGVCVTALAGMSAVGTPWNPTYASGWIDQLPFKQSLLIRVASSLGETDKIGIAYKYYTT